MRIQLWSAGPGTAVLPSAAGSIQVTQYKLLVFREPKLI
jgi:hypothetical protein